MANSQTHNRRSSGVNLGRFLTERCSTPIWCRRARFSSSRAERERKIENRVGRTARKMSIGRENYHKSIIPFLSDTSRFSGGTDPRGCRRTSSQHWRTFVRNHAKAIVAGDFLVAITAGFRVLYVFVVMEVGSRRILHCNVTAHPTAAWTLQQFREAIPSDHTYRFL